jgi:hypothetical protein
VSGCRIGRYNGSVRKRVRANLYIRADADVIARAKRYAAEQKVSLSHLVEEHFLKLIAEDESVEAQDSDVGHVNPIPQRKRSTVKVNRPASR